MLECRLIAFVTVVEYSAHLHMCNRIQDTTGTIISKLRGSSLKLHGDAMRGFFARKGKFLILLDPTQARMSMVTLRVTRANLSHVHPKHQGSA
jgi:hypothetical protein